MGAWGVSIYSSDDALDLRASIRAVCRLPYNGDKLVELLADLHSDARDPGKEGHSTFWLVVADQFQRRGIRSMARQRALEIIADGTDLAMFAKLGMADADLRKRKRLLDALGDQLRSLPPEKRRSTLKQPQPLLFGAGDVLVYRIDGQGNCCNPYLPDSTRASFKPVGWDGCLVVASGLALEYLAWYQLAPTRSPWKDRPTLSQIVARIDPARTRVGTMSRSRVARMGLELLGTSMPPKVPPPPKELVVSTTAQDIDAGNILSRWARPGALKI